MILMMLSSLRHSTAATQALITGGGAMDSLMNIPSRLIAPFNSMANLPVCA